MVQCYYVLCCNCLDSKSGPWYQTSITWVKESQKITWFIYLCFNFFRGWYWYTLSFLQSYSFLLCPLLFLVVSYQASCCHEETLLIIWTLKSKTDLTAQAPVLLCSGPVFSMLHWIYNPKQSSIFSNWNRSMCPYWLVVRHKIPT